VQNPRDFSFSKRIPQDDTRERLVCDTCGWINYTNPKIVVGSVVSHEGRILLCRRAIEPRRGFWTIPAGYLEEKETTEAGAMREAQEEACAEIAIDQLLAVYNIPRISQVQLIYRATLVRPDIAAGPESLEVRLVEWSEIPWSDLAFPSVHWALGQYRSVLGREAFPPFSNPPGETGNYPAA
jgi:ADP-ribose pyrophosphatase YjhB (NUDIX family)